MMTSAESNQGSQPKTVIRPNIAQWVGRDAPPANSNLPTILPSGVADLAIRRLEKLKKAIFDSVMRGHRSYTIIVLVETPKAAEYRTLNIGPETLGKPLNEHPEIRDKNVSSYVLCEQSPRTGRTKLTPLDISHTEAKTPILEILAKEKMETLKPLTMTERLQKLSGQEKGMLAFNGVMAGVSLYFAIQSASQAYRKDEKGDGHVQWGAVGWTCFNLALGAINATMVATTLRSKAHAVMM